MGGHVAMLLIRGQESCSFLFPVLGSPGAPVLARGGSRQCRFMWFGDRMSAPRCTEAGLGASQPGAHAEVSGSAAGWCPPPPHPPTFLAGGGLPGWWEAAGPALHSLQKPGVRFQGRLVGCEIEKGVGPCPLSWSPLPSSASRGCPRHSLWQHLRPPRAGSALPLALPSQL